MASVSQEKTLLQFRGNFLKEFRVNLKAGLGLTNIAPLSSGKIEASFQVILRHRPRLFLGHPYYEPLLWFMTIHPVLLTSTQQE